MTTGHSNRPTSNATRPTPPIGVLMLDTRFPRPPGDIGNPATFDFPVVYRVVERATPARVVDDGAEGLVDAFCEAARDLEATGVSAITTSCGFLALHQRTLADAVSVPVLTSSLLQVPLALAAIGRGRDAGVVTFKAEALTPAHFAAVGVPALDRVTILGLEGAPAFYRPIAEDLPTLDVAAAEREIVAIVAAWASSQPDLGALVLECTNLPPYSAAIQRATGLPLWDVVTLVRWAHEGVRRQ
jgi:Asp/Glu/hydantoin racemase